MAEILSKSGSISQQAENNEIDLTGVLNLIKHSYKLILIFVIIFFIGGVYYAQTRPPQYRSTADIEVGNNDLAGAIGAGAKGAAVALTGLASQQASTSDVETVLLHSPYILGQVARQMGQDISVSPYYSGFLARELSRFKSVKDTASVSMLSVPNVLLERPLILIPKSNNQYTLSTKNGEKLLDGTVGKLESATYNSEPLQIQVMSINAKPGAKLQVVKEQVADVAESLSDGLSVREEMTGTGILRLAYVSGSPEYSQKLLNTILAIAVAKNIKEKSQETAKALQFIADQLPSSKKNLDKIETKFNQYTAKTGVFDFKTDGLALENRIYFLKDLLDKSKSKKDLLMQQFTSLHPLVIAETEKENQLLKQINQTKEQLKMLPTAGEKEISLKREAMLQEKVYTGLEASEQTMEMMKSSMVSGIRILSPATYPVSRIPVKKRMIIFGSCILGFLLSLCYIFTRHVLSPVIEDPDVVERRLGIPVAAIVPYSQKQMSYNRKIKQDKLYAKNNPFILSRNHPNDQSIESIRSLRTTIQMALLEAKNNVIAITGCSPGVGKSFISSNLAMVLSDLGKRIVIVDSDIRLGKLSQSFGKEKIPGLSCYLKNEATLDQVIQNVVPGKFDFISTGLYPENPSELLSQNILHELIKTLSTRYDLVVIDTPPILAVTDSALILRYSSINLMVLGVGKDQMKEVLHAKAILEKGGVTLTGVVFNTLKQHKSGFGYNYGYANYHYTYEN